jgi:hypothetical protein
MLGGSAGAVGFRKMYRCWGKYVLGRDTIHIEPLRLLGRADGRGREKGRYILIVRYRGKLILVRLKNKRDFNNLLGRSLILSQSAIFFQPNPKIERKGGKMMIINGIPLVEDPQATQAHTSQ